MIANKYKAALTLGAASVGLLAGFPYSHHFWGGLLTSACQAAVVGGLADWFAVTALFRKPLGIPFRTAIVPRNRKKIFQAIAEMVQVELLSKENIAKTLVNYDLSAVALHFLNEHDGRKYLKEIVYQFAYKFIEQVEPDELGVIIGGILKKYARDARLAPLIIESSEWLIENKYDDQIIDFFIAQLESIGEQQPFRHLLGDLVLEARKSYERDSERRRIFNDLFQLSQQQLAKDAQKALLDFLDEVKSSGHPLRSRLKDRLVRLIVNLRSDEALQQQIEDWKTSQLSNKIDFVQYSTSFIAEWRMKAVQNKEQAAWLGELSNQLNQFIDEFAASKTRRLNFDHQVKQLIGKWLDSNQAEIGSLVKNSLKKMTDDMLVEFIETRVGNDLQMIRINGSVVGGLAGMCIYLLTFWW
ncbi:Uncharacterized membrane-anchored protein YjiN, DUF445 family [Dendrosporobacter quercicolus]|uniref:Uncharacterized membrane-anchored protein YjiN, DUF445 family n=2 Tax=Dendrosporobacter quercicolus TaxID=146817 RepID=A0A1G9Q2X7_9FIRM|nr:Uncharacterized membrane-anchored protein YjiN, DUF445 family [Dendrosporobacter quercicolus]